jgi:hypothetical protein
MWRISSGIQKSYRNDVNPGSIIKGNHKNNSRNTMAPYRTCNRIRSIDGDSVTNLRLKQLKKLK